MTLKLKINPYDTLLKAKFQIFFLSKTRLFVFYQNFNIGFRTQLKTNWCKSLKRTTTKIRTLRRNPVIRWPMTLLSSIKVNALMKIKTSISLKNAIFFIFYNRRIIFFFTKNNYCDDKPLGTYFTESCIVLQTYSKEFTTTGSFVGSSWYLSRWP